ncbi:50S ribosomal protein L27 [Candidatus Dojkabacteria bacterium]|nr:50S ribosomal protein L27 [Candidatus Dojkabacteria bacterium]
MAHVAAGSSKARQGVNVAGKRRGLKVNEGQSVKPGVIIIRQLGTKMYPGENTKMGKDFTIYATKEGTVSFKKLTGYKRGKLQINVV